MGTLHVHQAGGGWSHLFDPHVFIGMERRTTLFPLDFHLPLNQASRGCPQLSPASHTKSRQDDFSRLIVGECYIEPPDDAIPHTLHRPPAQCRSAPQRIPGRRRVLNIQWQGTAQNSKAFLCGNALPEQLTLGFIQSTPSAVYFNRLCVTIATTNFELRGERTLRLVPISAANPFGGTPTNCYGIDFKVKDANFAYQTYHHRLFKLATQEERDFCLTGQVTLYGLRD